MSFFNTASRDNVHTPNHQHNEQHSNGFSHHRQNPSVSTTQDRSLKSRDIIDVVEKGIDTAHSNNHTADGQSEGGLVKKASIRKRFSTLKLGTKKSKNALMGDVREE